MTMKISQLALVCGLSLGLGGVVGCSEETAETGDEQNASSSFSDVFAKVVLKGGCGIKVGSATKKTTGSGGACPKTLTAVLDALEKDTNNTVQFFMVSEQADQLALNTPVRFVASVTTKEGGPETLWLSMLGSPGGMADDFLEVMSFNKTKGVYAYYDLADGGWVQEGDGSSVPTEASGAPAKFRCINCHTDGNPVMKELHDGWWPWFSTWYSASAMQTFANGKGVDPLFKRLIDKVDRADDLERHIIDGTKAFTKTRVKKALKEKNLKPLAAQLLCDVGTPNLISPHGANSKRIGDIETFNSFFPSSILLNNFFKTPRTGSGSQLGLEGSLNMTIPSLSSLRMDATAYKAAIKANKQTINGKAGDAIAPLTAPEKSYADFAIVQELMTQGFLDKDIVADALMVDFTVSTFSKTRCDLAATLPKTWANAEELRTAWIQSLGSSNLRGAKGLKARLEAKTDIETHAKTLETYVGSCSKRQTSDVTKYTADVVKIVSQRRREFIEVYEQVVESPWLLPEDNHTDAKPHTFRLSGDKCEIQKQTEKFIGE